MMNLHTYNFHYLLYRLFTIVFIEIVHLFYRLFTTVFIEIFSRGKITVFSVSHSSINVSYLHIIKFYCTCD